MSADRAGCRSRTIAELLPGETVPWGDVRSLLGQCASPLVGAVGPAVSLLRYAPDARSHESYAKAHATAVGHRDVDGSAAKPTAAAAGVVAQAEAVERYCAEQIPSLEHLPLSSAARRGGRCIDVRSVALYSAEQYAADGCPFQPLTPHLALRWVPGRRLAGGSVVDLPADLVYLHPPGRLTEPALWSSTSSGLAAGATWREAAERAVLELVERDALMFAWRRRPALPTYRLPGPTWPESRRWRDLHADVRVVDLSDVSAGGIPVMVARAVQHGVVGFGAGVGRTPREAYVGAVTEAFQTLPWARRLRADEALAAEPRRYLPPYDTVRSFDDHTLMYAAPERLELSDDLFAATTAQDPTAELDRGDRSGRGWDRLALLADALGRDGVDAYLVDVTSVDVAEAGLYVVRAVAPQLAGIDADARFPLLGSPRLVRAVPALGLADVAFGQLTLTPHPLP